jgi:hypothetical protein
MSKKVLYAVIVILVLVIVVGLIVFSKNNTLKEASEQTLIEEQALTNATEEEMVDCGQTTDPMCFLSRMNGCLPVTTKMAGSDGSTSIEITILGQENEKCHFQRKINGVMDLDCYFSKGTLNMDTLDQTFGNDKGLQKVVDESCKSGLGW